MGCCKDFAVGFAKYILFVFNLLILVAAAILIAMAVKIMNNNHGLDMHSATIFPIVLGVFIALIAFFGCCGAVRESSCMLTTYATILMILFIIQLVLGILALIAIKKNDKNIDDTVHDYLQKQYEKIKTDKTADELVDNLQRALHCCGLDSKNEGYVRNGTSLIPSCCSEDIKPCTSDKAYDENCTEKLTDSLESITKVIGGVSIAFGVIELVASIFACYVKNAAH